MIKPGGGLSGGQTPYLPSQKRFFVGGPQKSFFAGRRQAGSFLAKFATREILSFPMETTVFYMISMIFGEISVDFGGNPRNSAELLVLVSEYPGFSENY